VRARLAAVFQAAPACADARVMEAELLLGERDFSGARARVPAAAPLHAASPSAAGSGMPSVRA